MMYQRKGKDLTQSYDKSPYIPKQEQDKSSDIEQQGIPKRNVTTQKTPPKMSITQLLWTDLGRSVGVTIAT